MEDIKKIDEVIDHWQKQSGEDYFTVQYPKKTILAIFNAIKARSILFDRRLQLEKNNQSTDAIDYQIKALTDLLEAKMTDFGFSTVMSGKIEQLELALMESEKENERLKRELEINEQIKEL